jgi:thioesterase domain-containing protein
MKSQVPGRFKHLESIVAAKLRPRIVRHEGCPGRSPFFFFGGTEQMIGRFGPEQTVVVFGVWSMLYEKPSLPLLVEHYFDEVRRLQPRGPYLLGGFCFWGLVAYELACKLAAAGQEVQLLCLVEAGFPSPEYRRLVPLRRLLLAVRRPDVVLRRLARPRRNTRASATATALEDTYMERLRTAQRGYSPSFYPGRLTLVCGDRSAQRFFPAVGWRSHVAGEIGVRIAKGEHLALFKDDMIYNIINQEIGGSVLPR